MTADILILPIVRVEREAPTDGSIVVLHLQPRAAARLRSKARDCRIEPDELAAQLLEKILFPEESE